MCSVWYCVSVCSDSSEYFNSLKYSVRSSFLNEISGTGMDVRSVEVAMTRVVSVKGVKITRTIRFLKEAIALARIWRQSKLCSRTCRMNRQSASEVYFRKSTILSACFELPSRPTHSLLVTKVLACANPQPQSSIEP